MIILGPYNKTPHGSGFLGLAVIMTVDLYQFTLLSRGGQVPGWMIGGYAHLGVLSILAIVMGFAVPTLGITGNLRTAVSLLYPAGQWGIPAVVWFGEGFGILILLPTGYLWGECLILSMLIMFYMAITQDVEIRGGGPTPAAPADD